MSQALDWAKIHGTGRSLEAMGPAKDLVELSTRGLRAGLFEHREERANLLHVIAVLDLKRGQQLLVNILQATRSF
jgi:hypothetical protein